MKLLQILDEILYDFWYRLNYFIRHDFITILMWAGKFAIGFLMIVIWDLKQFFQFFERKKKKGGVR